LEDKRIYLMKNKPISKAILTLALPAIAGMVVTGIYNIVDTFFVGRLGYLAIGSTQIVMPVMMVISAFGMTIGVGAASYLSRLLGNNDIAQANRTAATAFYTTLGLGALATLLGLIYLKPILILFGATDEILPLAADYGSYIVMASVFSMSSMTLNNMLRAEGSAKASMMGMLIGAGLNIALDPIFIFVLEMGVAGAALATALSQTVGAVILFCHYVKRRSILHLHARNFSPTREIYSEIMKIGTPTLLRQGLFSAAMAIMNNIAGAFGDTVIASLGIVNRIVMFAFFILFGFAQGFQPVAGFNYGAKQYRRLWQAVGFTVWVTTGITCISAVVIAVFAPRLVAVFQGNAEVVEVGARAMRYMTILLPFMGYMITINMLFQAMGRALPAAFLSLARQGIYFIPIVMVMPKMFGLTGLLLSQPAADFLTIVTVAVLSVFLLREIKREMIAQKTDAVMSNDISI